MMAQQSVTTAAASRIPQNCAAPAPGKGAIEGLVRDKITGQPVRRAVVRIGVFDRQLAASTDDDGHFAFRALPPGAYWPMAQAPGYTATRTLNGFGEQPKPVTLDQNTDKAKTELFLYPTATMSGHVLNDANEPVSSCQISAIASRFQNGQPILATIAYASTDANGEYRLGELQRGRYALSVRCDSVIVLPHPFMKRTDPATPRLVYPHQYLGGTDFNSAQKIIVEPGSHLEGIDIRLPRVQTGRLEGVVNGASQSRGATLFLQNFGDSPTVSQQYNTSANTQTGRFTFADVAPGEYRLIALVNDNDGNHFLMAEQMINVKANETIDTEVALEAPPPLSGAVTEAPPGGSRQLRTGQSRR